jgi:leader peptidase (prepilin peptidase)/N-methyltransferase
VLLSFATLLFAVFGLIIGSFLNVVIVRKGVMSLMGRSVCTSCGAQIAWYDNIPLISFVLLSGRCRNCGSAISIQYFLVEAITAILFALLGGSYGLHAYMLTGYDVLVLVLQVAVIALLIAIAVYDMRHTIIPDEWSYSFAGIALLTILIPYMAQGVSPSWIAFSAGPLAALPLFLLWLVSGGRWMGLGDPKLALGIGWLLGFPAGIIAVFASFMLGSLVLLPMMLVERVLHRYSSFQEKVNVHSRDSVCRLLVHMFDYKKDGAGLTMKTEVPFGPFLIASCFIFWFALLYGVDIPHYIFGL